MLNVLVHVLDRVLLEAVGTVSHLLPAVVRNMHVEFREWHCFLTIITNGDIAVRVTLLLVVTFGVIILD